MIVHFDATNQPFGALNCYYLLNTLSKTGVTAKLYETRGAILTATQLNQ
jgi:hypothetical protein